MPENNVIVETAKCVWVSNEKEKFLIGINQNQSIKPNHMERFCGRSFCFFSAPI